MCIWETDNWIINKRVVYKTGCGEQWYQLVDRNRVPMKLPFVSCPFCSKQISAKNTEQANQPDNSPKMCEECSQYPADLPSNLCCGCDAYKEHLS